MKPSTQLRPGVRMSKEIGNRATTKIAEETHRTPNSRRLDTSAIAEREERVVFQNVVGDKHCCSISVNFCNRSNVEDKFVLILYPRRQTAAARYKIRSHTGTEQVVFRKVVCEFCFPYVGPDGPLREPAVSCKGCGLISVPRLKMVVPIVISTDFEIVGNVASTSNAKYLTAFEIAESRQVLGPNIASIWVNFGRLRKQRYRRDCKP